MIRLLVCALFTFIVISAAPLDAFAQKKKVEITKKWDGSVDDEKAIKPEAITSAKGLEAVWKAWKIATCRRRSISRRLPMIHFTRIRPGNSATGPDSIFTSAIRPKALTSSAAAPSNSTCPRSPRDPQ